MLWFSQKCANTYFIGARYCEKCRQYELFEYGFDSNFKAITIFPIFMKYRYYTRCNNCGYETDLGKKISDSDIKQILKKFYYFHNSNDKFVAFYNKIVSYIIQNYANEECTKENISKQLFKKNTEYDLSFDFYKNIVEFVFQVFENNENVIHEKLKKLNDMFAEKLITEEEYNIKKQELLSKF